MFSENLKFKTDILFFITLNLYIVTTGLQLRAQFRLYFILIGLNIHQIELLMI